MTKSHNTVNIGLTSPGEQGGKGKPLNRRKQDRVIFRKLINHLDKKKFSRNLPGQLVMEIGKLFLGTPYRAGALERKGDERLAVNLRELDCVTFVENVVALAWHLKSGRRSFEAFRGFLQKTRYRDGHVQGYPSRLHYFSDWIHDNQKKGIVRDVTRELGGRPRKKAAGFMTTHPDLYPKLKRLSDFRAMRVIERSMSRRPLFFVPKDAVRPVEVRIRDGDIIAITTNIEGLDVQHVGLAARVNRRIHLLHASSREGKVVLSPKTLCRYLRQGRTRSGIMVARLV